METKNHISKAFGAGVDYTSRWSLFSTRYTPRGLTLIDVVVGTAIMLMVFLAIFGAFKISVELVYSTKAKTGGVSLMTERLEYIRSLPYASVGTVGGIPAGGIPQLEQTNLNGITYTVRTLIQYVDAPQDGLDEADENSITADYKRVKVEVLWSVKGSSRSTFAVTHVSPPGEETLESGGTLKVNVFNTAVEPVVGAAVHIVNTTTNPIVDIAVETNASGIASFPGAPAAGSYEITTGGTDNYSTAQTYSDSTENPNPSPAHIAVIDGSITSITFFIDVLGSLRFHTYEPVGPGSFDDAFDSSSKLSATTSANVTAGALTLVEESAGVYATSGSARSVSIAPSLLNAWDALTFTESIPAGTSVFVQLYFFDGTTWALVPDDDLPGNSVGFSSSPIDISTLVPQTYGTLALHASLSTSDTSVAPELLEWTLSYTAGPTPLPGVSFDIHGSKTIGTNGGSPVYKYTDSFTSNASAEWFIDAVEWDTYVATLSDAYDIAKRCPNTITLSPGQALDVSYFLAPPSAHYLRVYVASGGTPVSGATVSVSGISGVLETGSCGQTYFGGIPSADYTVTVSKPGFNTHQETLTVNGGTVLEVGLTAP